MESNIYLSYVIGERTWKIHLIEDNFYLRSVLWPFTWAPYTPFSALNQCPVCLLDPNKFFVSPFCRCGIYSYKKDFLEKRFNVKDTSSGLIMGDICLWGKVVEHKYGYRGQYGYPKKLYGFFCTVCHNFINPDSSFIVGASYEGSADYFPFCFSCENKYYSLFTGDVTLQIFNGGGVMRSLCESYGIEETL